MPYARYRRRKNSFTNLRLIQKAAIMRKRHYSNPRSELDEKVENFFAQRVSGRVMLALYVLVFILVTIVCILFVLEVARSMP